jgi:hypothetical protein
MVMIVLVAALVVGALLVVRATRFSFAAQRPGDYRDTSPAFDIARVLGQSLICEGAIFGPTGRVAARFTAGMEGRFNGQVGEIDETFAFAGGGVQLRQWQIKMTGAQSFTATAADIIGTAVGEAEGHALCMRYRLRLSGKHAGQVVNVRDWLYLLPDGTVVNRSQMRKFGILVAELVATIRPVKQ